MIEFRNMNTYTLRIISYWILSFDIVITKIFIDRTGQRLCGKTKLPKSLKEKDVLHLNL